IFTGMPTAMAADFPTSSPTPTSTDSESKLDMPLQIERVLKLEPIEGESTKSTDSTKSTKSTDTTEKNPAAPTSTTSRTYSQPATLNLTPKAAEARSVASGDISTYYSGTTDWTKALVWFGNGNNWTAPGDSTQIGTGPILFRTLDANTNEILMLSETWLGMTMWQPHDQGGNYQGSTIQNTMTSLYTTKFQSQIGGWLKSVSYDNISTSGTKDAIYPLS
ncbi:MAG: hypothetical protein RR956_08490, partial [Christensenella sp.]